MQNTGGLKTKKTNHGMCQISDKYYFKLLILMKSLTINTLIK